MNAFFGQALTAGKEWPRRDLTTYTRTINYDQKSSKEEMSFAQPVFGFRALRIDGAPGRQHAEPERGRQHG